MIKSFNKWQFVGIAVTIISGVLLHFLYEWSGEAKLVAPFSAVNESTWEHMKLLFFPAFIFAIIESFFFKDKKDFWDIKLKGILIGLALIPIIFYTFNGVIGESPDWVNITIFVLSTCIIFLYEVKLFQKDRNKYISKENSIILLCFIASLFILFTFYPLDIAIFKDLDNKR